MRVHPEEGSLMNTRTQLLRDLGRTEFTVRQMADRVGVSIEAARSRLTRYVEDGLVERTSDVLQYVDDDGRPQRGRPAHLYRVR
jgi:predicted ArsR family transcriptional regulator